ncbi:MAG: hypothetical protein AB7O96_08350, partial [Pseudobdellovibrionaceae bacterium]
SDGSVIGYMWLTDYMSELGYQLGGTSIYPSVRDCKENRRCDDQQGIVEVRIQFSKILEKPVQFKELVDEIRQYRRSWTVHKIPGLEEK